MDWQAYSSGVELTYDEAVRLAQAIFRTAQKAERKEKALLPTAKEVDGLEEAVCGTPTIIQSPPLSFGELARGKPYEL